MIRVLVYATSPIARAGLETVLRASANLEVIASEGATPDVIVADWQRSGEELPQDLLDLAPAAGLIVLVDEPAPELLRAGARGVLSRDAGTAQLIAAVEAVAAGLVVLPAEDLEGALAAPRPARLSETLSVREVEVLGMMAEGLSNKMIAYRLGISEHTVKFHVTSIMTKLNAGSRTEAVTTGIRHGLIMV